MSSTISSKGQLTIPKNIRRQLHLDTGDKLEFILDGQGGIHLIPLTVSVKKLKGIVPKPKKIVSLEEIKSAIERES
jgi:antitoxin PrlF